MSDESTSSPSTYYIHVRKPNIPCSKEVIEEVTKKKRQRVLAVMTKKGDKILDSQCIREYIYRYYDISELNTFITKKIGQGRECDGTRYRMSLLKLILWRKVFSKELKAN